MTVSSVVFGEWVLSVTHLAEEGKVAFLQTYLIGINFMGILSSKVVFHWLRKRDVGI